MTVHDRTRLIGPLSTLLTLRTRQRGNLPFKPSGMTIRLSLIHIYLPFEVFPEASPLFERDITEALDIPSIVAARTTEGGTAPAAVAVQLQRAEAQLVADEGVFGSLTKVVEMGHGAK